MECYFIGVEVGDCGFGCQLESFKLQDVCTCIRIPIEVCLVEVLVAGVHIQVCRDSALPPLTETSRVWQITGVGHSLLSRLHGEVRSSCEASL